MLQKKAQDVDFLLNNRFNPTASFCKNNGLPCSDKCRKNTKELFDATFRDYPE